VHWLLRLTLAAGLSVGLQIRSLDHVAARSSRLLPVAFGSRLIHLSDYLAQSFDFSLIGVLLQFRVFEDLQDFFQIVEGLFERTNNLGDFLDCLAQGRRTALALGSGRCCFSKRLWHRVGRLNIRSLLLRCRCWFRHRFGNILFDYLGDLRGTSSESWRTWSPWPRR
jgi:hypothetical protein